MRSCRAVIPVIPVTMSRTLLGSDGAWIEFMELVPVGSKSSPRSCGQTTLVSLCVFMYLVNSSGRSVSSGLELVGETYVVKVYGMYEQYCSSQRLFHNKIQSH